MVVEQNQEYQLLKRYLGYRYRIADNIISFDYKRLWEFRYKLQHEEPRVKVVSNSDGDNDNAVLLTWDKDLLKGSGKLV